MFTLKQILELKQKCEFSTQYHTQVYTALISYLLQVSPGQSDPSTSTKVWLKGTYIPKDNLELTKLINELIDDGFSPTVQYIQGSTYLDIKWN